MIKEIAEDGDSDTDGNQEYEDLSQEDINFKMELQQKQGKRLTSPQILKKTNSDPETPIAQKKMRSLQDTVVGNNFSGIKKNKKLIAEVKKSKPTEVKNETMKTMIVKAQMKDLMKQYLNRSPAINEDLAKLTVKEQLSESKKKNIPSIIKKDDDQKAYSQLVNQPTMGNENEEELFYLQQAQWERNQKKQFKYLLRVNDSKRIKWDLFVMTLAIWNCYSIPFDVAFEPQVLNSPAFIFINFLIDFFFILDIIVNFRTTFLNTRTGDEISDSKLIAKEYLKYRFWIDLIPTISWDYIFLNFLEKKVASKLQLFQMMKLLRVLRLGRIITYMKSTDEIKLSLKLLKLFFFLVMYLHCQACAWYYIVSLTRDWYPPYLISQGDYTLYTGGVTTKYFSSFYISVQLLCGGDITPKTNIQAGISSFFLIIGAIVNANIFGNIVVLVSIMNRKASRFQEQIDIANTAMKNMKLSEDLQWKVQDYMMFTQSNLDNQKELDIFLNMISPSLRLEVTQHIFLNAIEKNSIFKGNQEIIEFMVHNIVTLLFLPEDSIIRQGQKGHHLFFLAKGNCEVWVRDQFKREGAVKSLSQGKLFGEVALINQTKRTASVKSKNYCTLAALGKEIFYEMCQQFPDVFFKLKFATREYVDKWKLFQIRMIQQVEYFKELQSEHIEELHYLLTLEYFDPNTDIFSSGDQCRAIYFIVEGEIDLLISQKSEEYLLDTLYHGCSIGAYSFLKQWLYPYSGRAKTKVTLLVLHYATFIDAKEYIEDLEFALWDAQDFIDSNSVPLCDYKIYRSKYYNIAQPLTPKEKFHNAVRRIMILSKRNGKKYRFLEILKKISDRQTRELGQFIESEEFQSEQKKLKKHSTKINAQRLPPFLRKIVVQNIRNKTHDEVAVSAPITQQHSLVRMLSVKIDQLSDTVRNQHKYIRGMQNKFNRKLTRVVNQQNMTNSDNANNKSDLSSKMMTEDDEEDDELWKKQSNLIPKSQQKKMTQFKNKASITMSSPKQGHLIPYGKHNVKSSEKKKTSQFFKFKIPISVINSDSMEQFIIEEQDNEYDSAQESNQKNQEQDWWETGATKSCLKSSLPELNLPFLDPIKTISVSEDQTLREIHNKKKVVINFADMDKDSSAQEEEKEEISKKKKRKETESTQAMSQQITVQSQQVSQQMSFGAMKIKGIEEEGLSNKEIERIMTSIGLNEVSNEEIKEDGEEYFQQQITHRALYQEELLEKKRNNISLQSEDDDILPTE